MMDSVNGLCTMFANMRLATSARSIANQHCEAVRHLDLVAIEEPYDAFGKLGITIPKSSSSKNSMTFTTSTIYPAIKEDVLPGFSLAHFPMEIILDIVEAIFSKSQILTIDIFGPKGETHDASDMDDIGRQTRILLRPPPLNAIAETCRLFRHTL